MKAAGPAAAGYIARWRPSSVSPQAAAIARGVVMLAGPGGRERAKSLLRAAGKLADYAMPLGLEAVPELLLHPSAVELFTRCAPGLSPAARRMRATGLICLGAGAGLIRGDLRDVRGTDVACRSGGVLVQVRGPRARTVPVLARYQDRLLAAAGFAGSAPVCGGTELS